MNGPEFLLLYVILIAVALLITRWFNHWRDPRSGEPLPAVPSPADPYELAWLRGGSPEAIRLAAYELIHADLLESSWRAPAGSRAGTYLLATLQPEPAALAPLARVVLRACATPQKPKDLMRGSLVEGVDAACRHWQLKHEDEGFLLSLTQRKNGFMLMIGSMMILIGITYARVSDTFAHGHANVLFLLALTVVAIVVMYRFGRPATRLTTRGSAYLKRLQSTLAPRMRVVPPSAFPRASRSELNATSSHAVASSNAAESTDTHQPSWSPMASAALVPVALYGMAALPGSEQREMTHLFPQADPKSEKADNTSGGGCGTSSACGSVESNSSWFSSDSSSSSDGGGSSGCGGSGCGGGGGGGGGD